MQFPIDKKFVIAVSSSALFDLSESHEVFLNKGPTEYKKFQEKNIDKILSRGAAFPFIKRFLSINNYFPEEQPVEVVLLSRNSAATGQRVFRSIQHYGLDIQRAAFMEGKPPYEYIPAFNASLFLSANEDDALKAIEAGYPAGAVLPSATTKDDDADDLDNELRIAFDFDGVIIDDEAEATFKKGGLPDFIEHETSKAHIPHNPGPLADLFKKLSLLQKLEDIKEENDKNYQRIIRTAIVTARSSPTHERVVTTLENWGVSANETFFLGGMNKGRILKALKPHMFFDDQRRHLDQNDSGTPLVHIPFGVANNV